MKPILKCDYLLADGVHHHNQPTERRHHHPWTGNGWPPPRDDKQSPNTLNR